MPREPDIHIRRYEPSDIDDVISLFRDTVRRIARRDYTQDQVIAWAPDNIDREARAIRHSSKPTWIAEIGSTMVGFADLEPDGHLDCMYVHADYQGRGVASRLLAEVETVAKARGLTRLYSEVSITARPFFERRGFRLIAAQIVTARGQEFLNYRMEKFLAGD